MKTASITSFQMKSPVLAKVVVSTTGNPTPEELRQILAEKMDYKAAVVDNSFRQIRAGVMVGFMRANREVRVVEPSELKASYRVLSSNILMDNHDRSLWELKSGAGGQYLARQTDEDLSELIEANVTHMRQDVPKIHQLTASRVRSNELVAFVTPNGSLDYGFVLRSNSQKAKVLAMSTQAPVTVENELIAGIYQVEVDREVNRKLATHLRANGLTPGQKLNEVQYYRALYDYSPEYLDKVIKQIESDVAA